MTYVGREVIVCINQNQIAKVELTEEDKELCTPVVGSTDLKIPGEFLGFSEYRDTDGGETYAMVMVPNGRVVEVDPQKVTFLPVVEELKTFAGDDVIQVHVNSQPNALRRPYRFMKQRMEVM